MADFAPYIPEAPKNDRTFAAFEYNKGTVVQVDNDSLYSKSVVRQIKKNRELEDRKKFIEDGVDRRQIAYRKRKLAGMFDDYEVDYPQPSGAPITVGDSTDKPVVNSNLPAPLKPTFKGVVGFPITGKPAPLQARNKDSSNIYYFDDLE